MAAGAPQSRPKKSRPFALTYPQHVCRALLWMQIGRTWCITIGRSVPCNQKHSRSGPMECLPASSFNLRNRKPPILIANLIGNLPQGRSRPITGPHVSAQHPQPACSHVRSAAPICSASSAVSRAPSTRARRPTTYLSHVLHRHTPAPSTCLATLQPHWPTRFAAGRRYWTLSPPPIAIVVPDISHPRDGRNSEFHRS